MARTFRAAATVTVERDIEDVFAYLAAVTTMDDWVKGVSETRHTGGTPGEVGATYAYRYRSAGTTRSMEMTVEAVERPTRLVIGVPDGSLAFTSEITLEAVDGGTRVTNAIDATVTGRGLALLTAVAPPLVRWLATREMTGELEQLKSNLEDEEIAVADDRRRRESTAAA
ncbi:SRPBCC family protein [Halobellus rubicundus]|uniref:SRPBCC family protein n=1 Tax=Halobellus rubicundus TaxID=2996466 RepID=A0ABD5MDA9_9EURY